MNTSNNKIRAGMNQNEQDAGEDSYMCCLFRMLKGDGVCYAATMKNKRRCVLPMMKMNQGVRREIMRTIGALRPEAGGILLGPVDSNEITAFYFDGGAQCGTATYSPDCETLSRKMREEWLPSGLDMKGFVHSHPGLDQLSSGDLSYIARLLAINPDMSVFSAPIVLPETFQFLPFMVFRDAPSVARPAILILS